MLTGYILLLTFMVILYQCFLTRSAAVSVDCVVSGLPEPKAGWMRIGASFPKNGHVSEPSPGVYRMKIFNVSICDGIDRMKVRTMPSSDNVKLGQSEVRIMSS